MTCKACQSAERDPMADTFTSGCLSCQARAMAVTGGHMLPPGQYHQACRKVFGERIDEGKPLVDGWAKRVRQARAAEVTR